MPSIESLARWIDASGLPALFVDTCSLLDIPRLALPNGFRQGEADAARNLLRMAIGSPQSCVLVVSSLVRQEWEDNIENVVREANIHLKTLDRQSAAFHEACRSLQIPLSFGRANYASSELVESLRDLSGRLLNAAASIDEDEESRSRAGRRLLAKISPASVKQEWKDCVILEEYLSVCRALEALGSKGKRVFCTSNKKDYCLANKLLDPLPREFADLGLAYSGYLAWAISGMGLSTGSQS
jgi:hypothetical protein